MGDGRVQWMKVGEECEEVEGVALYEEVRSVRGLGSLNPHDGWN